MTARKMKDSGIEWIGEIPSEWGTIKVKYTSWLKGRIGWDGLTSNEYIEDGPYLITGVNFKNGKIDWNSCVHISQERFDEDADIHIKENDLLITKDGTIGKVAIAEDCPECVSLNSGVLLIRNNCDFKYFAKYFYYVLLSDVFWRWYTLSQTGQSTIKHLYQEQFSNFEFSYPPLPEQRRIADYLDRKCAEIDRVVAETEKTIEEYKVLKQSIITEAVTKGVRGKRKMKDSGIEWIGEIPEEWGTSRVKNLADPEQAASFIDGDWIESPDISSEGIRYLTTGNVGDGQFKRQGNGFITEETFLRLNCKYAYPGDLVIARLNAPYGRACILPDDFDKYVLAVDIVILRTKMCKPYLCYQMQCEGYQRAVEDEAKGATMKRISRTHLGKVPILLPPLPEQREIADYLDAKCAEIDRLVAAKQNLLAELATYKKSVIYEYVTGKKEVPECL